ncbi:hypothetical protein M0R89_10240 [Halorussus limi]|uniref:Uncharacterized protein n=1 Tax=Halorussus limi TaxID=2938695 RepID=A0A8U0HQB3_9EURY|nr:hypothetical protein [Halorussus limi]UPV72926.1 hypothetical protein M0R89_10240 [Halorussus limi]
MMWQDFVFLAGSVFSLVVLVPTLRDSMANVPLGTALPSATIGFIYGTAFLTLGMTMSAVGSLLTGVMWSLIAALRSPHPYNSTTRSDSASSSNDSANSTTNAAPHAD